MFEGANIGRNRNISGNWAGKIIARQTTRAPSRRPYHAIQGLQVPPSAATRCGHGRDVFRVRAQHVASTRATCCAYEHETTHETGAQTTTPSRELMRHGNSRASTANRQETPYFFPFSKSRISVSSSSSLEGAGGAEGAAGAAFFRFKRESRRTNKNTEKAMTRKSNVTCRKFP